MSHIGKLYSLLAPRMAEAVVSRLRSVEDATRVILNRIGRSVNDPNLVDLGLLTAADASSLEPETFDPDAAPELQ